MRPPAPVDVHLPVSPHRSNPGTACQPNTPKHGVRPQAYPTLPSPAASAPTDTCSHLQVTGIHCEFVACIAHFDEPRETRVVVFDEDALVLQADDGNAIVFSERDDAEVEG